MDERRHQSLICFLPFLIAGVQSFGCGRLADDDAGADASPPDVKCTDELFTSIAPIAELNTSADERGLRLTPDELMGVFTRVDDPDADQNFSDIRAISRSDSSSSFSDIQLGVVNAFVELNPSPVGNDLDAIFFESLCDDGSHAFTPFCLGRPAGDAGLYETLLVAVDRHLNPAGSLGPFPQGAISGDGFVTTDGSAYYFASSMADAPAVQSIFADDVERGVTDPNPAFTGERLVLAPADPADLLDDPVVSNDGLSLFVSSRVAGGPRHIVVSQRATADAAFTAPAPLHELDSSEGEFPTWISPDRCRLYFTRITNGQGDLYVASRSPH